MGKKTNEIRKRIENAEKRKGRELTEREKQKIERKVILKYRKENAIRGLFLTLGLTIGAGGHALLTNGNDKSKDSNNQPTAETQIDNEVNNNDNSFKTSLTVDTTTAIIPTTETEDKEIDYDKIISEVLDEYNEKYDTELSPEDIAYMQSKPQFLGISNGTYIQDYKQKTPVDEYLDDYIGDIYIMINKNDDKIIASLGKVKGKIENVDTKVAMNGERKEYFESDKKIDLTENKNEEEIKQIYDALEKELEKDVEKDTERE